MDQVPAPLPDKSPKKMKVSTPWWLCCSSSNVKQPKPVTHITPIPSTANRPDLDKPVKLPRLDEPVKLPINQLPSSDKHIIEVPAIKAFPPLGEKPKTDRVDRT